MTSIPRRSYVDELFCADDGGGGPYWVAADDRSASEALAMVERIDGAIETGCSVELVVGVVAQVDDHLRFEIDQDGNVGMWQVDV